EDKLSQSIDREVFNGKMVEKFKPNSRGVRISNSGLNEDEPIPKIKKLRGNLF
ncbi:35735_t:CDS:1, partial [Racocetra persica]